MTWLGRVVAAPLVALSFLTVATIPMPGYAHRLPMGWAVACFPIGGAIIGLCLAGIDWLLAPWLPAGVLAAVLLATLLGLTGALHLDGLMDSFDGLFGGKDREKRLAIMKDSRVGSFGIAAAISVLLMEYASLSALASPARGGALVLAVGLSRWGMAALLWVYPAATPTGLAAGLKPEIRWPHLLVATAVAGLLSAASGLMGFALFGAAALLVAIIGAVANSKIGGITGDSCGAAGQLVEMLVLVGASAWR